MRKIIRIDQQNPNLFVYWHLTDFCNYKCNYCPSFLNDGQYATGQKPGFPNDAEIDTFINKLSDLSKARDLMVVLSGGEPTVHSLFPEILDKLKKLGKVGIVTNGSRTLNWWRKLTVLPDYITLSLHPEYVDMKHINQLSKYLIESGALLTYNLSVDPTNWQLVKTIYDQLEHSYRHRIRYKMLHEFNDNTNKKMFNYTQEQLDWVKDNFSESGELFTLSEKETVVYYDDGTSNNSPTLAAEVTMTRKNSFYDWKCSAGSNGIKVHTDGIVYAGICASQNLGHMTNFELLKEPLTCKLNYCVGPGDIRLPKYNPTFKDYENL